jgi:F-type H+-transporting ATPase subunit b
MLDVRSQKIQKGLEDAAAAAKARQNAEAEADKIMAEARSERQKLLEEARQAGEDVKKQIESEARQEAERIRAEGRQEADIARNTVLSDVRDQVLQISAAVAGRVLQENIDAKKQAKLVSDFFAAVPEGAKNMSGNVEVFSAMPLSDAEKKSLEGAIKADGYTYTVDPNILGGIVVRGQDKVVDGSVRSSLNELSSRLK